MYNSALYVYWRLLRKKVTFRHLLCFQNKKDMPEKSPQNVRKYITVFGKVPNYKRSDKFLWATSLCLYKSNMDDVRKSKLNTRLIKIGLSKNYNRKTLQYLLDEVIPTLDTYSELLKLGICNHNKWFVKQLLAYNIEVETWEIFAYGGQFGTVPIIKLLDARFTTGNNILHILLLERALLYAIINEGNGTDIIKYICNVFDRENDQLQPRILPLAIRDIIRASNSVSGIKERLCMLIAKGIVDISLIIDDWLTMIK